MIVTIYKKKAKDYDVETYIDMLNKEKKKRFGNNCIPQCLWDYYINFIYNNGIYYGNNIPRDVVENAINNGDYGDFDDYKYVDETDEDFIERMKQEDPFFIDIKQKVVCFSI